MGSDWPLGPSPLNISPVLSHNRPITRALLLNIGAPDRRVGA
jgi:hypothetical protein